MIPQAREAGRANRTTSRRLLGLEHELVRIPSAWVLAALRREIGSDATTSPRTIAILADPVFERTDPRVVPATARRASPSPAADTRAPLDADTALARLGVGRLPFSRMEAEAIVSAQVSMQTDPTLARAVPLGRFHADRRLALTDRERHVQSRLLSRARFGRTLYIGSRCREEGQRMQAQGTA